MNVFELRDRLVGDYASYTRSFIKIRDARISEHVDHALGDGAFWPEPLLQLNPTFLSGGTIDVARFFHAVMQAATVSVKVEGKAVTLQLSNEVPRALRQARGRDEPFTGRFDLPLQEDEIYLGRTSPVIEGLAGWTLDQALDPVARDARPIAARCGIVSTSAVSIRTTLLVARFRYHLQIAGGDTETILCEEIVPLACTGSADAPQWLAPEDGERLLAARPERNLIQTAINQQLGLLLPALPKLQHALASVAKERSAVQLAAHERVREASRTKGRVSIQPVLPVDILGAYVLLSTPGNGRAP